AGEMTRQNQEPASRHQDATGEPTARGCKQGNGDQDECVGDYATEQPGEPGKRRFISPNFLRRWPRWSLPFPSRSVRRRWIVSTRGDEHHALPLGVGNASNRSLSRLFQGVNIGPGSFAIGNGEGGATVFAMDLFANVNGIHGSCCIT